MLDLLRCDVVSPLHVSDQIVSPRAVVRTGRTFEGPHPVVYPHVKAEPEGRIESFPTLLTGVSHVSTVAPETVVKAAPEPVAFPTHRAGVELLS